MINRKECLYKPVLIKADFNRDNKTIEKILTPEVIEQPGVKIARNFIDILGLPYGQLSTLGKGRDKIASALTNKAGMEYVENGDNIIFRDPRFFFNINNSEVTTVMPVKLKKIFENEYRHWDKKKKINNKRSIRPFEYISLPGEVDVVLKGFDHHPALQEIHGWHIAETAKNAEVISIEGVGDLKFGDSLNYFWKNKMGVADLIMRDAVKHGFKGLFTETDMRDMSKIEMDYEENPYLRNYAYFPHLPDEFFNNYAGYLKKYFPEDYKQIKNRNNLEGILKKLSLTNEGLLKTEKYDVFQGIIGHRRAFTDGNLETKEQMTGLELGQEFFSEAMDAIKIHLIGKEMNEGRINKGIIMDFRGAAHTEILSYYVRNPLQAMITVLKNPHYILQENLVSDKDDINSVLPSFSPNENTFKEMFRQIWKIKFAKPYAEEQKDKVDPGYSQMPLREVKINKRDNILKEKIGMINFSIN